VLRARAVRAETHPEFQRSRVPAVPCSIHGEWNPSPRFAVGYRMMGRVARWTSKSWSNSCSVSARQRRAPRPRPSSWCWSAKPSAQTDPAAGRVHKKARRAWHTPGQFMEETKPSWGRPGLPNSCNAHAAGGAINGAAARDQTDPAASRIVPVFNALAAPARAAPERRRFLYRSAAF
jgi:hypothetical protein